MSRVSIGIASFAALLAVTGPALYAQGHDETAQIRLEITDTGFICTDGCDWVNVADDPWEFVIAVEEGQRVQLAFAWAHTGYVNEQHIMVLKPYKLEWDQIDSQQREASLEFIADTPGTFDFECDVECELHDFLQYGHLEVGRGSGATSGATLTATHLEIKPSAWVTEGEIVSLMAVLRTSDGQPVPKAGLQFFVESEFAGVGGQMAIGTAETDMNGVAFFEYRPTLAQPKHAITGRFDGMAVFDASTQAIEITVAGVPPSAYVQAPMGLAGFWERAPMAIVIAVAGVWAVLGFVVYQIVGIARTGARRAETGPGSVRGRVDRDVETEVG